MRLRCVGGEGERTLGDEVEAEGELALEDVDLAALLLEREQVVAETAPGAAAVRLHRRHPHLHRRSSQVVSLDGWIDPHGRERRGGNGTGKVGKKKEGKESSSGRRVYSYTGREGGVMGG